MVGTYWRTSPALACCALLSSCSMGSGGSIPIEGTADQTTPGSAADAGGMTPGGMTSGATSVPGSASASSSPGSMATGVGPAVLGPGSMGTFSTTAGAAGAVVMASGQDVPVGIAVDGVNLYWMTLGTNATKDGKAPLGWTGGRILKCPVAGCGGDPVALASNLAQGPSTAAPAPFTSDGGSVYWSDWSDGRGRRLVKCGVAGCGDQPVVIGSEGAQGLAVFQGNFYWTEFSATLYACPIGGCGSSEVTIWSAGYSPCNVGVAVDASGIYWVAQAPNTLFRCPLAGCGGAPTVLMAGSADVADARQVALDANNVYFTDGNPEIGMVLACAKSGCGTAPTVLASGLDAPIAVATDGINVYWTEARPYFTARAPVTGTGLVRKCAVGGCGNAPTNVATGLNWPGAIALDDANVYWTEGGTAAGAGKIWKAPK